MGGIQRQQKKIVGEKNLIASESESE